MLAIFESSYLIARKKPTLISVMSLSGADWSSTSVLRSNTSGRSASEALSPMFNSPLVSNEISATSSGSSRGYHHSPVTGSMHIRDWSYGSYAGNSSVNNSSTKISEIPNSMFEQSGILKHLMSSTSSTNRSLFNATTDTIDHSNASRSDSAANDMSLLNQNVRTVSSDYSSASNSEQFNLNRTGSSNSRNYQGGKLTYFFDASNNSCRENWFAVGAH